MSDNILPNGCSSGFHIRRVSASDSSTEAYCDDDDGGGGVVTQKMTVPTNKFKWYNTDSVAVCVEEEVEEELQRPLNNDSHCSITTMQPLFLASRNSPRIVVVDRRCVPWLDPVPPLDEILVRNKSIQLHVRKARPHSKPIALVMKLLPTPRGPRNK